jgi:uroporphyrin-III C-methyltransferase/precorrin-2 dehydrogenase/sirohydrochlorin ferrochelatase
MGVGNAPLLRRNLLDAGAAPQTSVVIVENGTLPTERAVATTLQDLSDCIAQLGIAGPAVIFVGLDWQDAGLQRPEPSRSTAAPAPFHAQPSQHRLQR